MKTAKLCWVPLTLKGGYLCPWLWRSHGCHLTWGDTVNTVSFGCSEKKKRNSCIITVDPSSRRPSQPGKGWWSREHQLRATKCWWPQSKCKVHIPGTDRALRLLARGTVSVKGHKGQMEIVRIRDATPCNRHTHTCFQPEPFPHIIPVIEFNTIFLENRPSSVLFYSWLSLAYIHTHTSTQRNLITWWHSIPTVSSNIGAIPLASHGYFLRMFFQWWPNQPLQPDLTSQPLPGTSIFQNLLWFLVELLPSLNRENFSPHSFAPKTLF